MLSERVMKATCVSLGPIKRLYRETSRFLLATINRKKLDSRH